MPLTGRFYFRRTVLGKVVLMVEEEKERTWSLSWNGKTRKRWRDASLMDLTHHELRKILELQDKFSTSVNEPRDDGHSHKPSPRPSVRSSAATWSSARSAS